MLDIHKGQNINDSIVMKTGRIMLELLDDNLIEAFYLGFHDRIAEVHDEKDYKRVGALDTVYELFYLLGYKFSSKEIEFSEMVKKNPPSLEDFKSDVKTYLDRFDIVRFYEKNNP